MSIPCEVAVKCVLPSVRAMIAKELTTKHSLKQKEAAKLLGVSQPAISLYYRKIRGKAIDLESDAVIMGLITNMAGTLAKGDMSRKDFVLRICEICKIIRQKGLLCRLHKAIVPSIDVEKCELCLTSDLLATPRC